MARSLNKVIIIGNLTRDPELRYTPQGTAVCTLGVATNRQWKTDGETKEEVEYHRLVVWDKLAEICEKFLSKGDKESQIAKLLVYENANKNLRFFLSHIPGISSRKK